MQGLFYLFRLCYIFVAWMVDTMTTKAEAVLLHFVDLLNTQVGLLLFEILLNQQLRRLYH